MPVKYTIGLGIMGIMLVVGWLIMPRYWRGHYKPYIDGMYGWLGLSRPARRGMYRATPVTAISMTMCFTGAAIGFAAVDHLSMSHPLLYVVLALIFGGIFLFFVGVLSIVWFNFPKFLVIPHARQHVGLAAVLRRARRIRRAARERAVPPARPR